MNQKTINLVADLMTAADQFAEDDVNGLLMRLVVDTIHDQDEKIERLTRERDERTTAARTCYAAMFLCEATRDRSGRHFAAKWPWLE